MLPLPHELEARGGATSGALPAVLEDGLVQPLEPGDAVLQLLPAVACLGRPREAARLVAHAVGAVGEALGAEARSVDEVDALEAVLAAFDR